MHDVTLALRLAGAVEALGSGDFHRALSDAISGMLAADNHVTVLFARDGQPAILEQTSPQLPNYFRSMYCQGVYLLDPFYMKGLDGRDGVWCLDDVVADNFYESDFFIRYYEKVQMIDEIGLLSATDGGDVLHLSFGRRSHSPRFAPADLDVIRQLEPLVHALLRAHGRFVGQAPRPVAVVAPEGHWLDRFTVTAREKVIADLVLRGHSNLSIGLNLGISAETVKVHRRNLYAKLTISSSAELFGLFLAHVDRKGV